MVVQRLNEFVSFFCEIPVDFSVKVFYENQATGKLELIYDGFVSKCDLPTDLFVIDIFGFYSAGFSLVVGF